MDTKWLHEWNDKQANHERAFRENVESLFRESEALELEAKTKELRAKQLQREAKAKSKAGPGKWDDDIV